jgi:hypothetical protein
MHIVDTENQSIVAGHDQIVNSDATSLRHSAWNHLHHADAKLNSLTPGRQPRGRDSDRFAFG